MENQAQNSASSLGNKIYYGFAGFLVLVSFILALTVYWNYQGQVREAAKERLRDIAAITAIQVDATAHNALKVPDDEGSPTYLKLRRDLQRIRDTTTDIRYIYTMRQGPRDEIVFVLDAETIPEEIARLGDLYDDASELLRDNFRSLDQPLVENDFYTDKWGTWLTGYAPFYTQDGQRAGVVGIDIAATHVMERERLFLLDSLRVLAVAMLVILLLAWLIGRRLSGIAIKATQALSESEVRFRDIVRASGDWFWEVDTEGRFTTVSDSVEGLLGYTPAEMLDKPIFHFMPPEEARRLGPLSPAMIEKAKPFRDLDNIYVRKDGTTRYVQSSGMPIFDADGKLLGYRGLDRDISKRKHTEAAILASRDRLSAILQATQDAVWLLTMDTRLVDANPAACTMLGYSREEMLARSVRDFEAEHDEEQIKQNFEMFKKMGSARFESRHRAKDGRLITVDISISLVPSESIIVGFIRDITERKRAEKELRQAASVFKYANEGIMITDPSGVILDVNHAFTRITGYNRDEVLGQNPRLLSSGRHDDEYYARMWKTLKEQGNWTSETWNRRKNGEVYAEMQTVSAVYGEDGEILRFVSLFSDITSIKEHQQQLEHIAHYDALTNLPNRTLLGDRIHQAMVQAQRHGTLLALIFLDLDGFKDINDAHGHAMGDHLLVQLAGRMQHALRDGDTLARLGGDEFVAVLLDLDDREVSVPVIERLLGVIAEPVFKREMELRVSASLGVTFFPQDEQVDADQLLRQGDQAMYLAKQAGKNRYHLFDSTQDRSVRGHHESLERIRTALRNQELVLYYQPKANLRTGEVVGVEALIRWQQPERGLLLPDAFLPAIESHPLCVEVGEWVLETAMSQVEVWRQAGLSLPVSINIDALHLQQPNFIERMREQLAGHPGIQPGDLELEVLETSALEDITQVTEVIHACRDMGINFALDDFGTGYSSLTYLKRLPAKYLKIDRIFVRDMLDDPNDFAIIEGVLGLASAFRLKVIAEGMESGEQGVMLLQLGCELAQGYGIARPMPAHEVRDWITQWTPEPAWSTAGLLSRDKQSILYACVEHKAWFQEVMSYLERENAQMPTLDHMKCRFGCWLENEKKEHSHFNTIYRAIDDLHRQVHAQVERLIAKRDTNSQDEMARELRLLCDMRDDLLAQLRALAGMFVS